MADAPGRAMLVLSLLGRDERPRALALERLAARWGPLCHLSRPLAFDYSDYYAPEMGSPLTRRLAAFSEPVEPGRLIWIKRACQSLEADLALAGRRRVNLDPGLLSAQSLVLATSKHAGHRLALGPGLWQELTLWFHHGQYHPLPWTYPDYAGDELRGILAGLRRRHLWRARPQGNMGGRS